ncbi:MAG TPA: hypothetical protein VGK38_09285, partial [Prolixibacteraceae bacterium]
MKTSRSVLLIFLLLIASSIKAQDTINNFQVTDGELFWQKVYPTTLTFEQLLLKIKDSGLLEKTEVMNNKITGDLRPMEADYKGAGFSRILIEGYIWMSNFYGFAIIDFQQGKYRVTLKKMIQKQKEIHDSENHSLESFVLNRKKEIKDSFKRSSSLI